MYSAFNMSDIFARFGWRRVIDDGKASSRGESRFTRWARLAGGGVAARAKAGG